MDILLLRFDAPLMSFGGVCVDAHGVTMPLPGRAMLTGLVGNALGLRHDQTSDLGALQARIVYAARADRPGQVLIDYQTTDLGQTDAFGGAWLQDGNWTTRGRIEERGGGTAKRGTDIRYRHYLADGCVTVALALRHAESTPNLDDVAHALKNPARPLFIGRKSCLPATPIVLGRVEAPSVRRAVEHAPVAAGANPPLLAWWPASDGFDEAAQRQIGLVDDRDWENQVHAGRRWMVEGSVIPEQAR